MPNYPVSCMRNIFQDLATIKIAKQQVIMQAVLKIITISEDFFHLLYLIYVQDTWMVYVCSTQGIAFEFGGPFRNGFAFHIFPCLVNLDIHQHKWLSSKLPDPYLK